MLFTAFLILGSFLGALAHTPVIKSQSPTFLHKTPRHPRSNSYIRDAKNHRHKPRFLNLGLFGTRVTASTTTQTSSQYSYSQQTTGASFFIRKQIYSYFQECHEGVVGRVKRITEICSGQITNANAKSIAWELLVELQAILALLVTCVRKIKGCGSHPTPSGIPNGPDDCSVQQIGQIIFQMMGQLRICFTQMNSVCSQYEIIRMTCNDCLVQISSSASECMSASGVHLNGLLSIVTNLLGGNVQSFFNLRVFGLNSIFQVLNSF